MKDVVLDDLIKEEKEKNKHQKKKFVVHLYILFSLKNKEEKEEDYIKEDQAPIEILIRLKRVVIQVPKELLEEIEIKIILKHLLERIELIGKTDQEKINQKIEQRGKKACLKLGNSKVQYNKKVEH